MNKILCIIIVGLIISNVVAWDKTNYYKRSLFTQISLVNKLNKDVVDFYNEYKKLVDEIGERFGDKNEISNNLRKDFKKVK